MPGIPVALVPWLTSTPTFLGGTGTKIRPKPRSLRSTYRITISGSRTGGPLLAGRASAHKGKGEGPSNEPPPSPEGEDKAENNTPTSSDSRSSSSSGGSPGGESSANLNVPNPVGSPGSSVSSKFLPSFPVVAWGLALKALSLHAAYIAARLMTHPFEPAVERLKAHKAAEEVIKEAAVRLNVDDLQGLQVGLFFKLLYIRFKLQKEHKSYIYHSVLCICRIYVAALFCQNVCIKS